MSTEPWAVAKKALTQCGGTTSSCPSFKPRVLRQSSLSADDKGDNEMIPEAVHRSPAFYLTAEEIFAKPQLGDRR
jgi:hypothetical protein